MSENQIGDRVVVKVSLTLLCAEGAITRSSLGSDDLADENFGGPLPSQADERRARLLKDRLKSFFEAHNLKTLETPRYRFSLAKNGGKAPLILDESVPVTQLPERFFESLY